MDNLHLFGSIGIKFYGEETLQNPGPPKGPLQSVLSTEPCLERPSPTRPLQRQTTWAGRSLREPSSPTGRLVKSGSLGSARGAQPTVEAGVAHSKYPYLTFLHPSIELS